MAQKEVVIWKRWRESKKENDKERGRDARREDEKAESM